MKYLPLKTKGLAKKALLFAVVLLLSCFTGFSKVQVHAADVQRWGRYEVSFAGPSAGNPFTDVWLKATFSNGTVKVIVDGFYDGKGIYKIRFMPKEIGRWSYFTTSNVKALTQKNGFFNCIKPVTGNHGPVQVSQTFNFKYADSTQYYPFGTTMYAWTHQGEELQQETLTALKTAGFNKVRMCVFPKYYTYVEEDPLLYPYATLSPDKRTKGQDVQVNQKGGKDQRAQEPGISRQNLEEENISGKDTKGRVSLKWNFKKFDPLYFEHLEKRIDELSAMGIEADLIIFHPYDKGRWGFDNMGQENDVFYLKYLVARLASFRNVWWSMANEYDFIKTKPRNVWDLYSKTVVDQDPYHHLCSIHNGSIYYDNSKSYFTHLSVQNGSAVEDFGRAVLLRDAFFKPIVYDEVCYEGNLPQRWGHLTGPEMLHAFWQGIIAGTYVTHGETIKGVGDTISWAKGGKFKGESPKRIAFLRKIMEDGPGPLKFADEWKDLQTAQVDSNYYLIYFGKEKLANWKFSLPKKNGPPAGSKFKVEVIDTWDMTIVAQSGVITTAPAEQYRIFDKDQKVIQLPEKPYMALRITRVKD